MTLLAHWPLSESAGSGSPTAIDVAAGGSGSHNGTYNNHTLVMPGIDGFHLFVTTSGGTITSILNESDFLISGDITLMCWLHAYEEGDPLHTTQGYNNAGIVISKSENNEDADGNIVFQLQIYDITGQMMFIWEYGTGSNCIAYSGSDYADKMGWTHIAAVRENFGAGPNQQIKWYKNGQYFSTDDNSSSGFNRQDGGSVTLTQIGRNVATYSTRSFHTGSIRVYDEVVSPATIATVYDSEKNYFQNVPVRLNTPSFVKIKKSLDYEPVYAGRRSGKQGAGFEDVGDGYYTP
jgi:hypothetical protein